MDKRRRRETEEKASESLVVHVVLHFTLAMRRLFGSYGKEEYDVTARF